MIYREMRCDNESVPVFVDKTCSRRLQRSAQH
jgi:hypothetical protein